VRLVLAASLGKPFGVAPYIFLTTCFPPRLHELRWWYYRRSTLYAAGDTTCAGRRSSLSPGLPRAAASHPVGCVRAPADRLPSTRDLAEQLGISRTVVLQAYDQLLAEGFVTGRGGSGTYVCEGLMANGPQQSKRSARLHLSRFGKAAVHALASVSTPERRTTALRYDFVYGRSDLEAFPFEMWRRLLLRQARMASTRQYAYGSARGSPDLRDRDLCSFAAIACGRLRIIRHPRRQWIAAVAGSGYASLSRTRRPGRH
jgi:biotin operon repressor